MTAKIEADATSFERDLLVRETLVPGVQEGTLTARVPWNAAGLTVDSLDPLRHRVVSVVQGPCESSIQPANSCTLHVASHRVQEEDHASGRHVDRVLHANGWVAGTWTAAHPSGVFVAVKQQRKVTITWEALARDAAREAEGPTLVVFYRIHKPFLTVQLDLRLVPSGPPAAAGGQAGAVGPLVVGYGVPETTALLAAVPSYVGTLALRVTVRPGDTSVGVGGENVFKADSLVVPLVSVQRHEQRAPAVRHYEALGAAPGSRSRSPPDAPEAEEGDGELPEAEDEDEGGVGGDGSSRAAPPGEHVGTTELPPPPDDQTPLLARLNIPALPKRFPDKVTLRDVRVDAGGTVATTDGTTYGVESGGIAFMYAHTLPERVAGRDTTWHAASLYVKLSSDVNASLRSLSASVTASVRVAALGSVSFLVEGAGLATRHGDSPPMYERVVGNRAAAGVFVRVDLKSTSNAALNYVVVARNVTHLTLPVRLLLGQGTDRKTQTYVFVPAGAKNLAGAWLEVANAQPAERDMTVDAPAWFTLIVPPSSTQSVSVMQKFNVA